MSKKKPREATVPQNEEVSVSQEPEVTSAAGEPNSPLLAEVQSFLSKRDELARKLAEEIAATETKLAELRKTAASLFPESAPAASPAGKDKKVAKKLPKAKPLPAVPASEAPSEPAPDAVLSAETPPEAPSNTDSTPID